MLNITFGNSLVGKLALIANLSDWLVPHDKVWELSASSNHFNVSKGVENNTWFYYSITENKDNKRQGKFAKSFGDLAKDRYFKIP